MASGPPDPKVKPKLQQALEHHAPTLAQRRAGEPDGARQRPDTGRPPRHPRGDEAGVRLRLAQLRARRYHHARRDREPRLPRQGSHRAGSPWMQPGRSRINPGWTLDPTKVSPRPARAARDRRCSQPQGRDRPLLRQHRNCRLLRHRHRALTGNRPLPARATNRARSPPPARSSPRSASPTSRRIASTRPTTTPKPPTGAPKPAPKASPACRTRPQGDRRVRLLAQPPDRMAARPVRPGSASRALSSASASICRPAKARPKRRRLRPPQCAASITGSPQRVHQMAGVVLASLLDQGSKPVRLPSLVRAYDYVAPADATLAARDRSLDIVPNQVITARRRYRC